MAQGKFSAPRHNRDEDRQIEQAFRQVTGQEPPPPPRKPPRGEGDFDLSQLLGEEDFPLEEDQLSPEEDPLPPEEPETDWLDKAMVFLQENKKMVLAAGCALVLVLLVSVVAIFLFSSSDPYDNQILKNVYLADINVGGMTKSEAMDAVKQAAGQTYTTQDMVIDLSGTELRLSPKNTKASLDVKAAVNAAYDYGRTGTKSEQEQAYAASRTEPHIIGLLPYLNLDTDFIRSTLNTYAAETGSTLTQATYGLEGAEPVLATDKFNEKAPTQTLVITLGTPGIGFDANAVYDQVLDAYSLNQFRVTVDTVTESAEPDPVDLDAIYKEFYIAPVDDTLDRKTFQTIPGSYGYEFDLDAAKKLVEQAHYGETVRIPMQYIAPEIANGEVLFQDVLGEYQTKHTSNENRNTNLRLACEALNGVVLNPGETLSFNDTLGKRTAEKGYKPAPAYSGLETVDSIGGGICQVSSTLYYCTLLADLDVVSRVNHGFVPTYIDYGMDATVSWGGPDFKFRNSTSFPIQIQAEVSDGYVKVKLLGTDERDYYIKMEYKITASQDPKTEYQDYEPNNAQGYRDGDVIQEGTTGYTVKTYKCKYSNQTNKLLSRDYTATSQYTTVNRIVARVTQPETVPPTQPPTEPEVPTEAPSQPTEPPVTEAPAPVEPAAPEQPAADPAPESDAAA